jgi:hypothetical protein
MRLRLLQLLAIVSTALFLVPTGAHLFELASKLALSESEYMTVQMIYTDWSLFGIVIVIALLATLVHTVIVRADRIALASSLVAFVLLAMTQAIFWMFTYPMNVASRNWTVVPEHFEAARRQWEYSHAASAVLTFAALVALAWSILTYQNRGQILSEPPSTADDRRATR